MNLTEFLLARIAEDEAVARYLTSGYAQHKPTWRNPSTGVVDLGDSGLDGLQPLGDGPLASHIARWDPARAMAECEAKHRIIALHRESLIFGGACDECGHFDEIGQWGGKAFDPVDLPCPTLRLLALPYADHPDYRQEWKPQ